jgi:hypothetical protein
MGLVCGEPQTRPSRQSMRIDLLSGAIEKTDDWEVAVIEAPITASFVALALWS